MLVGDEQLGIGLSTIVHNEFRVLPRHAIIISALSSCNVVQAVCCSIDLLNERRSHQRPQSSLLARHKCLWRILLRIAVMLEWNAKACSSDEHCVRVISFRLCVLIAFARIFCNVDSASKISKPNRFASDACCADALIESLVCNFVCSCSWTSVEAKNFIR
jgi:hypothetical protein